MKGKAEWTLEQAKAVRVFKSKINYGVYIRHGGSYKDREYYVGRPEEMDKAIDELLGRVLASQRREWVGRIREVRENIKGWYGGRNKVGQPVVTRVSVLKALADILKELEEPND